MCKQNPTKEIQLENKEISSQAGFSLLEAIISMIIMSTALLLLANAWSASFSRVKKTQLNFELSTLLDRKMSEIQREFRGKPLSEIPEEKEEEFGDALKDFSWQMTSRKFEFPDITSSLTARSGGVDQTTMLMIKQMTEQISKSIKEVKVTIIYKAPKQPIKVSATTYFTDYDKPITFGGAGP